ncbi:MAG: hypothetical protein C0467_06870 [Planctomycetaceae bacterium]|nr:hypothetical protein [Planctomycetaceae bacterium]
MIGPVPISIRVQLMNWRRTYAPALLAAFLAGCGSNSSTSTTAEVTGTVTLDGKPLENAEVQFVPKSDPALGLHVAKTDSSGRFKITQDSPTNPVKPGTYAVLVSKVIGGNDPSQPGGGMDAQKNEVPAVYQDRNKTPLSADVREGSNTLQPFQITR